MPDDLPTPPPGSGRPTPGGTARPRLDSTLGEAANLRDTAAALSASQETTRSVVPPPRGQDDIARVVKDLVVKVDGMQSAMVVLMGATAKQLENSSRQEGKQDENTTLTARSVQWGKIGAAAVAVVGVVLPIAIVVYGKWLEQHPSASGALILAILGAVATALGVSAKPKAPAAATAEAGAQATPPGHT